MVSRKHPRTKVITDLPAPKDMNVVSLSVMRKIFNLEYYVFLCDSVCWLIKPILVLNCRLHVEQVTSVGNNSDDQLALALRTLRFL